MAFAQPCEPGGEVRLLPERPQPWAKFVPSHELQDAFKEWGSDARKVLHHVEKPLRYSIHTVDPPLESYVEGRVVLVGDAVSRPSNFVVVAAELVCYRRTR